MVLLSVSVQLQLYDKIWTGSGTLQPYLMNYLIVIAGALLHALCYRNDHPVRGVVPRALCQKDDRVADRRDLDGIFRRLCAPLSIKAPRALSLLL